MTRSRYLRLGMATAAILILPLLAPVTGSAQSDGTVALSPGDAVQIQVWRQPDLSGEFEITGAGTIGHPLYRELTVAGRPFAEMESELRAFLARFDANPQFVVEPLFRIPVAGEVRVPDVYSLRPETTISQAIALARGPTERGRLDRVVLHRDGEEIRIDLTDPRNALREMTVRSGDQIVVERRVDVFREYIAPSASIIAAIATVARLFIR
jgi:polysaccharide biosynthesis/export protein VpsN